jgi:hypothetical protein
LGPRRCRHIVLFRFSTVKICIRWGNQPHAPSFSPLGDTHVYSISQIVPLQGSRRYLLTSPPPPLGWSGTVSTITETTTGILYQPRILMDDECGALGGKLSRGNRNTRRKPAPVPLCPPQIPYDLSRTRTRASTVGSQRLTA